MWNIKAKKQNFDLSDPDSVELSHINESDLLSSSSKRMDSIKNRKGNGCRECEIYIEEIEKYKKNINTFHILFNNIGNILTKTIKDLKLNQKQKEMFVGIFKMLEGKNNDDKKQSYRKNIMREKDRLEIFLYFPCIYLFNHYLFILNLIFLLNKNLNLKFIS